MPYGSRVKLDTVAPVSPAPLGLSCTAASVDAVQMRSVQLIIGLAAGGVANAENAVPTLKANGNSCTRTSTTTTTTTSRTTDHLPSRVSGDDDVQLMRGQWAKRQWDAVAAAERATVAHALASRWRQTRRSQV